MEIADSFPRYREFDPAVPVWCVTPGKGRIIHRFFDTSPFSPSGRYLALFRMPYEDRIPAPGDKGEIVIVDLRDGRERTIAETAGWESQVGANVQWGTSDHELYYNDVDTASWTPFAVSVDPSNGRKSKLGGPVFMVSPDGRHIASHCLRRSRLTQYGYGVIVPDGFVPRNTTIPGDDGLYVTDTCSGICTLLASMQDILRDAHPGFPQDEYRDGEFYGFQCKWNRQGTRLLFVVRWLSNRGAPRKNHVITMNVDGSGIHLALPAWQWAKGGHHVNWTPEGDHITMNLNLDGDGLRFVEFRYDGTGMRKLLDDVVGSGHPAMHESGHFLVTDAYTKEPLAFPDGTVPLRFVNLKTGHEKILVRIATRTPQEHELRLDPHPAWDFSHRFIAFNGFVGGTRRVYVADLSGQVREAE